MATLRIIRKRIKSVQNTRKITSAMKMVSASKLLKAEKRVLRFRPYANGFTTVLQRIVMRNENNIHPLLAKREINKFYLITITSDRGLCGPFNGNVIRFVERFYEEDNRRLGNTSLILVGKRGANYFKRRGFNIKNEYLSSIKIPEYDFATEIGKTVIDSFVSGEVDAVYLVYNEFKSAIAQRVVLKKLLPIELDGIPEDLPRIDYLCEPSMESVLNEIIPEYIYSEILYAFLESSASEQGARMTAMESATNNAVEMISTLTLQFNRARQAAITKELMDIINGVEAMK